MTVQAPSLTPGITRSEVHSRAEALAKEMAPFAEQAEIDRRMPPHFADAVIASGLMPLVRPARYGGYETDWETVAESLRPMGQVSGSMTWCMGFLLQHQWILSHFSLETQDEVYSHHADPKVVTSFAPAGKVVREAGGYRVNGEWSFGSGGDLCDWAVTGSFVPGEEGQPPTLKWFLFKPGQFWMRDTWRSAGLKGTGSNNIVVENAFVEEAYAIDAGAAMMGQHPGRVVSSHPLYTTGILSQFQFGLTTPLLAISDGLHSAFLDFFRDQRQALAPGKKADNPITQMRVGESAAELSAARLVLYNLNRKVMAGEMKAPGSGELFMRDIGFIARLAQASADRLFTLSGARGLNEGNLFGRHWRDVHAICNHAALQADGYMQAYGALELTGKVPGAH